MIVVQRLSDGKFWRNTTGKRCWPNKAAKEAEWTYDLQDVKPYRNEAAAKHSFNVGNIYWGEGWTGRKSTFVDECCKSVKWNSRSGMKNQCEHYKAAKQMNIDQFFKQYKLVPVVLSFGVKS